jgi:hypothetical protein
MRINLIEWLVNNYYMNRDVLKSELQYSFNNKNLGKYYDKKELSAIHDLGRVQGSIDRLFIWQHADSRKGLGTKEPFRFLYIDADWRKFCDLNYLDINDVYYDFNFFKKEKLKIKFEGD